jgi:hypothetical protein
MILKKLCTQRKKGKLVVPLSVCDGESMWESNPQITLIVY